MMSSLFLHCQCIQSSALGEWYLQFDVIFKIVLRFIILHIHAIFFYTSYTRSSPGDPIHIFYDNSNKNGYISINYFFNRWRIDQEMGLQLVKVDRIKELRDVRFKSKENSENAKKLDLASYAGVPETRECIRRVNRTILRFYAAKMIVQHLEIVKRS